MVGQVPAGALVDATPKKRLAALAALLAVAASALLLAAWPATLPVLLSEVLHGFASCVLAPAVAAISLALVGREGLGERLGRNARYRAIGNGIAAGVLGAAGTYVSGAAVFWLTAALCAPALAALAAIRGADLAPPPEGAATSGASSPTAGCWSSPPAARCSPCPTPPCFRWRASRPPRTPANGPTWSSPPESCSPSS
jgi:MFS family permease